MACGWVSGPGISVSSHTSAERAATQMPSSFILHIYARYENRLSSGFGSCFRRTNQARLERIGSGDRRRRALFVCDIAPLFECVVMGFGEPDGVGMNDRTDVL